MVKKVIDQSAEEKILNAARKVFIQKGLDGVRMQDIADEAGINKALLHYYFRTKEKLFEVIFKETAGKMFPKFEMILLSNDNLFDKIRKIIAGYLEMVIENPYLPLFVLNEVNRNSNLGLTSFFEKQKPVFAKKFVEAVEKEIAAGKIKPVSPPQLLINMMAMCVFPFLAKPIISTLWQIDELQFKSLMEQRKKDIADFIINSIKK